MSMPVKKAMGLRPTPKDVPGNDNPKPRMTGNPKVQKMDGTKNTGAGKYLWKQDRGVDQAPAIIWKDRKQP